MTWEGQHEKEMRHRDRMAAQHAAWRETSLAVYRVARVAREDGRARWLHGRFVVSMERPDADCIWTDGWTAAFIRKGYDAEWCAHIIQRGDDVYGNAALKLGAEVANETPGAG